MDYIEAPIPSQPIKPSVTETVKPVVSPAVAAFLEYVGNTNAYGKPIPEGRVALLLHAPASPQKDDLVGKLRKTGLLTREQEESLKKDGKVSAYLTYLQERLEELQVGIVLWNYVPTDQYKDIGYFEAQFINPKGGGIIILHTNSEDSEWLQENIDILQEIAKKYDGGIKLFQDVFQSQENSSLKPLKQPPAIPPDQALAQIKAKQARSGRLKQAVSDRKLHNIAAAKARSKRM